MPSVARSAVSLRFRNADLGVISSALGAPPDKTATSPGLWLRRVKNLEPGDPDAQMVELLASLNSDLGLWREMAMRYDGHIFCGLFVSDGNQGVALRPETLQLLAERGLGLELDLYAI